MRDGSKKIVQSDIILYLSPYIIMNIWSLQCNDTVFYFYSTCQKQFLAYKKQRFLETIKMVSIGMTTLFYTGTCLSTERDLPIMVSH